MQFGKIIKEAWDTTRKHQVLWLVAGLSEIPFFLLILVNYVLALLGQADFGILPEDFLDFSSPASLLYWLMLLITLFISPISLGGLVIGIQRLQSVQPIDFQTLIKAARQRYLDFFFVPLLFLLIAVAVVFVFVFPITFLGGPDGPMAAVFLCLVPLICGAFILFYFLGAALFLVYSSLAVEDKGLSTALAIVKELILARLRDVVIAMLIIGIISFVFSILNSGLQTGVGFLIDPRSYQTGQATTDPTALQMTLSVIFILLFYLLSLGLSIFNYSYWIRIYKHLRPQPQDAQVEAAA